MRSFFKKVTMLSESRSGWLFVLAIPVLALSAAMYMQFGLGEKPCFYCIHERIVFFGLGGVAITGVLFGNIPLIAGFLNAVWAGASLYGFDLALTHTKLQIHPSFFDQCAMFIRFPSWLPLDKWLPSVFTVQAECSANIVRFGGLVVPQWLLIIFAISFIVSTTVLISNTIGKIRK